MNSILSEMPPVQNKRTVHYEYALNQDIINTIHKNFLQGVEQCKNVAEKFRGNTTLDTAQNIWNFLKRKIKYQKDDEENQDIRLPNRFVSDGTGDCKSYSLFTACILANLGLPVTFRYTSYSGSTTPTHVYVYTNDSDGNKIIIDGVYNRFNAEKKFTHKKDYRMKVSSLSGVGESAFIKRARRSYHERLTNRLAKTRNPLVRALINNQFIRSGRATGKITDIPLEKLKMIAARMARNPKAKIILNLVEKEIQAKTGTTANITTIKGIGDVYDVPGIDGVGFLKLGKIFKKIGKAFGKVAGAAFKGIKKLALAIPRNAFLGLVKVNFRGIASKLAIGYNNPAQKEKIEKTWKRLGGSTGALWGAVGKGKISKAAIKGLDGVGVNGSLIETLGKLLPVAGIIISAFGFILKLIKTKADGTPAAPGEAEAPGTSYDSIMKDVAATGGATSFPAGAVVTDSDPGAGEGAGVPSLADFKSELAAEQSSFSLSNNIPLIVGGGALLYFLNKKK